VLELLKVQARGDVDGVLKLLPDCKAEPACVETVRARAPKVTRPGEVKILNYQPSVQLALTDETGVGRVAWKAGNALPIVQCVRVERSGAVAGGHVHLLSISSPIGRESSCAT
jgi:hypothetical protein